MGMDGKRMRSGLSNGMDAENDQYSISVSSFLIRSSVESVLNELDLPPDELSDEPDAECHIRKRGRASSQ